MSNWFVIRADANKAIGIGHVMRCLALAEWLYSHNVRPLLLTKYPNKLIESKVSLLEGKIIYLPESSSLPSDIYLHSKWLNGSESDDAKLCIDVIENEIQQSGKSPLFIVVDHYALAAPWENKISAYAPILVVDDLSDRQHECKWLIDQTFGKTDDDYLSLVPDNTKLMIGPQYALIRKEFTEVAKLFKRNLPNTEIRVLLTLGGVDKNNDTSKALLFLESCKDTSDKKIVTTVVTSHSNPNLNDLQATVGRLKDTLLLIDVNNMAELMATHDICIGAAGSTSWERCVMSLPTLSIVLAENQKTIAKNLAEAEVVLDLGLMADITQEKFMETFYSLLNDMNLYNSLSIKSKSLCDGLGCNRIMNEIVGQNA
jgi:UDP-2,4-diacetamido-2,4,6-trideoxy-beta-L-altropyranose hydrolase